MGASNFAANLDRDFADLLSGALLTTKATRIRAAKVWIIARRILVASERSCEVLQSVHHQEDLCENHSGDGSADMGLPGDAGHEVDREVQYQGQGDAAKA